MFRLLQEQNDGCDRGEHTSLAFFAQRQHVFCRYWACYIVHVDFAAESPSAGLNSLKKEFDKISERLVTGSAGLKHGSNFHPVCNLVDPNYLPSPETHFQKHEL